MTEEFKSVFDSNGKEYKMKSNLYLFNTSYEVDGESYVSRVFAKSWEEAVEHIKQKKITEKISGYDPKQTYLNPSEYEEITVE